MTPCRIVPHIVMTMRLPADPACRQATEQRAGFLAPLLEARTTWKGTARSETCACKQKEQEDMTSVTVGYRDSQEPLAASDGTASEPYDPFGLDITLIEGTPAAETALLCSTSDNCGSSCPSACTTS